MRRQRGFTLIELTIAGSLGVIVALAAFVGVASIQRAVAAQQNLSDLTSNGRLALDLMTRDIRSAGDSLELLPQHCMAGLHSPGTPHNCAAVLDPHPWRITVTRNSWQVGSDKMLYTSDDKPPVLSFENNPADAVTYEFVPVDGERDLGGTHRGYIGQLRQIKNPFGLDGQPRCAFDVN